MVRDSEIPLTAQTWSHLLSPPLASLVLRACFACLVFLTFVFLLLPILFVLLSSFSESTILSFPPGPLTFRWYMAIPGEFWTSLMVSLIVALVSGIVAIALGTPAALALVRGSIPGRRTAETLLLSPLAIPSLVLGVAIYHYYLFLADATGLSLNDSMSGLMVAHTSFTIPYAVRTVMATLARMDPSLEEAAQNLGSAPIGAFFRITLPLIMPGIIAGGVFAFITSFDNVPVSLFLAGANATPLPIKIFTSIEFSMDPTVMAVSAISIYLATFVILIVERLFGLNKLLDAERAAGQ